MMERARKGPIDFAPGGEELTISGPDPSLEKQKKYRSGA
jgi:hypothetical protein